MTKLEKASHKKADISTIKNTIKRITVPLLATTLSICLCSGCKKSDDIKQELDNQSTIEQVNDNVPDLSIYEATETNLNELVSVPEEYMFNIRDDNSIRNLSSLKYLQFEVKDSSDLLWVNYCTNVEDLYITIYNNGKNLESIKGLKNLKNLTINFMDSDTERVFDKKNFSFIKNSEKLNNVIFSEQDTDFTNNFIDIIKENPNIKKLKLNYRSGNYNVDFNKIEGIEELDLGRSKPYDLAVALDNETLNNLKNKDIKINFVGTSIEEITEINNKLDSIIRSLGVSKNNTNKEKIDAILSYILNNYTYDKKMQNLVADNLPYQDYAKEFYKKGALEPIFNNPNKNIVCGNYSALFQALSNRLGVESYYLESDTHAWNMVCVEGEYYYIDATWLDGSRFFEVTYDKETNTSVEHEVLVGDKIKSGDTKNLEWYMMHPDKALEHDSGIESHKATNFPSNITIQPLASNNQKEPEIEEKFESKQFTITVNKKTWIISGSVLVGLLIGLGAAIKAKRYNKKRKNYISDFEDIYNTTSYNNDTYSNDYGNQTLYGLNSNDDFTRRR